jgi:POT family proton-dependent oligopeptide transporter
MKFVIGLLLISMGYGVMIGAAIMADSGKLVSPLWLVVMYLLHTMGEMCLSPVGLSAMSKLAPQKIASLTMGIWFLASSIGSYAGGRVAGLYEAMPLTHIFMALTMLGLISTIVLSVSSRFIQEGTEATR